MKKLIITHHGWAGNLMYFVNFFSTLQVEADVFHIDAGYFYKKIQLDFSILSKYQDIIGIGHSLGFAKLLSIVPRIHYSKLISLGGFARFCNSASDEKALKITIDAFNANPVLLLKNFYAKNGILFDKKYSEINVDELRFDLESLRGLDVSSSIYALGVNSSIYHIYNKNDNILGTEKSINAQLATQSVSEFALNGGDHAYYEGNVLELVGQIIN